MLKYLRNGRAGGSGSARASGGLVAGLMPGTPLLEDTGDHLIERRILNRHVEDGVTVEDGAEDFRDARAVHLEARYRPLASRDLAVHFQTVGHAVAVEVQFDEFRLAELLGDACQRTV